MTVSDMLSTTEARESFQTGLAEADGGLDPFHGEVVAQLRATAGSGDFWHIALLQAMSQWSLTSEHVAGRHWRYVIGGEALDGLTLAQRLCLEIPDVVPQYELEALLFRGQWPETMNSARLRELIGSYRYTALLNFRYGVVVEEALQLVAEERIRKSRLARCYQDSDNVIEDAYRHLYGETQSTLVARFLGMDDGTSQNGSESMSLGEWQEFTYWLFKLRVRKWHPARVASDTRRGLERLRELHCEGEIDATDRFTGGGFEPPAALPGRSR